MLKKFARSNSTDSWICGSLKRTLPHTIWMRQLRTLISCKILVLYQSIQKIWVRRMNKTSCVASIFYRVVRAMKDTTTCCRYIDPFKVSSQSVLLIRFNVQIALSRDSSYTTMHKLRATKCILSASNSTDLEFLDDFHGGGDDFGVQHYLKALVRKMLSLNNYYCIWVRVTKQFCFF